MDKGNGHLTDRKNAAGDGSRLSGGEYRRESGKERMRTEQVTKKEQSTNVRVHFCKRFVERSQNVHAIFVQETLLPVL